MYNARAIEARRCRSARADGQACRSWAAWDDLHQRCAIHAGRHHRGYDRWVRVEPIHARYRPCACAAYGWPHRPGGGTCEWPLLPWQEIYNTDLAQTDSAPSPELLYRISRIRRPSADGTGIS
jgi:hypothetical protein